MQENASDAFPGLRDYLVERFGPDAAAATLEPFAARPGAIKEGGYGVPHVVRWPASSGPRKLVLETVKPGPFGHEDPSDRAGILLRAYRDYRTLPRHVAPVGIGAFRNGAAALNLADAGEVFLLTEFAEGEPYAADFDRIAEKGELDREDRARATTLADYLAGVHREKVSHPSWYRRRLRELLGSGECIAGIADSYPVPFEFIDGALLRDVESLALEWRYRLRDRADRLRTVHGDFHPWNILFQTGTEFRVLDRSRGAFGDPADDVVSLAVNYLFFAIRTAGSFTGPFAELFRLFWNRYAERSVDEELSRVVAPHFAFRALVLANPLWYPNEDAATRRALFRFLFAVLENDRFDPGRIPEYLEWRRP